MRNTELFPLCRWQEGRCSFGDRCNYAHGEAEMRPLPPEGYEILERLDQRRGRKDVRSETLYRRWHGFLLTISARAELSCFHAMLLPG